MVLLLNQPTKQPTNQSANQATKQPTKQSANQQLFTIGVYVYKWKTALVNVLGFRASLKQI